MAATVEFVDPVLTVKNVARSAEWYRRMLGLKVAMTMPEKSKKPSFIRLVNDAGAAFMVGNGSDAMAGTKAPKEVTEAVASRMAPKVVGFYFRVDKDIDALYRSARRKGAKVLSPPTDMPYEMREFHLRDPDGYDVGIGQPTG